MTLAIITHVNHLQENQNIYAYSPYVREMNIWISHASRVNLVAPFEKEIKTEIDIAYSHHSISIHKIPQFNMVGWKAGLSTIFQIPKILFQLYKAMKDSDHIHLRCPGNVGLLGCFVQILFPDKPKSAKYAGNWDPNSKQPLSYRLQKWILSNTFLTRNMQVLVYGSWPDQTKNIKPFFTATYAEKDKMPIQKRNLESTIYFVFAGTLSEGKQPLYAIKIIECLLDLGIRAKMHLYGEGRQRTILEDYITEKDLHNHVFLKGNKSKETIQQGFQDSHFLLLPSKSEGWPKVVAEAMFWGCLPISSPVSCVPDMLDFENRGVLLEMKIEEDAKKIFDLINQPEKYQEKTEKAVLWSRKYTLDLFEDEIKKLLST